MKKPHLKFLLLTGIHLLAFCVPSDAGGFAGTPPPVNISGKVTNDKGEPLQGVSVLISGSKIGTTTNNDGSFLLAVSNPENVALEVLENALFERKCQDSVNGNF